MKIYYLENSNYVRIYTDAQKTELLLEYAKLKKNSDSVKIYEKAINKRR